MKELIGKKCSITILTKHNNTRLFFTGTIISVTDLHFSFIDIYGLSQTFKVDDIERISEVSKDDKYQ